MSEDKSAAENFVDSAKAKINEGVDRAKAAGHEVASHMGDNPVDNAADKAKAVGDRAKAEVHNAQAHAEFNEGKRESTDGDGH
ncbi:hypothetical protein DKM44_10320 [Deinococcus irradiatisoli]|uniref:Uncharacterized protein n=1 Tax=Deinococcus irradiatisoli TaxID=2202254 RepID=A0A2Z3JEI2_9DEIO|nr:hypothetical protein [Deinococcus irradiatisoli]AWN23573.1 hypothetical protein DKM44_10320 [Deinococcus irradiatisoli]